MKTLTESRNEAYLNKSISHEGRVMTRKQFIECLVSKGYLPNESTQEKYKCSRTRFNRMTGREQDAFDKKQCLIPYYSCYIPNNPNGFELSKIDFDYMNSLISK